MTDQGAAVGNLNELEAIDSEIWANVWMTDCIARVDPQSGVVKCAAAPAPFSPRRSQCNFRNCTVRKPTERCGLQQVRAARRALHFWLGISNVLMGCCETANAAVSVTSWRTQVTGNNSSDTWQRDAPPARRVWTGAQVVGAAGQPAQQPQGAEHSADPPHGCAQWCAPGLRKRAPFVLEWRSCWAAFDHKLLSNVPHRTRTP